MTDIEICAERKIQRRFYIDKFISAFDKAVSPGFAHKGESHDFWEIVLCEGGSIEVTEDENVYIMSDGDVLFHAPMEFHKIESTSGTTPRVYSLCFTSCGKVPEEIKNGVFRINKDKRTQLFKFFITAAEFMKNTDITPDYIGQEAADLLSAFILDVLRDDNSTDTVSLAASAVAYKKLVQEMHKSLHLNLSLTDFAERCFVSVSYMKSVFNKYAGISPKSYYMHLRFRESCRMLNCGIPIKEIAEKLNFSSPNYFALFFKKCTGMTPSQYKKRP